MYFVRTYTSGAGDYDPRQKRWAEYHCSLCGEDSDVDITRNHRTFDFGRDRKCPHCGLINAADREANLKAQLDKLTAERSKIEVEIDRIERELAEARPKEA